MSEEIQSSIEQKRATGSESALPYFLPLRIRRLSLAAILVALAAFLSGLLLDFLLIHARGVSQLQAAAILDAVFAIVVAGLFYLLAAHNRARRARVMERLETIDLMNHHIRNALQVISFNAHSQTNESDLAEIKRAMNRIQWALREILPKVEPEFSGFEGSARDNSDEEPFKSSASQKK